MAIFALAYEKSCSNEGGWCKTPGDKGGETYRGIARAFHPEWKGWPAVDLVTARFTDPLLIDPELEKDAALQKLVFDFYKANFWDTMLLDQVKTQVIAEEIFDEAILAGPPRAAWVAQEALRLMGYTLNQDGKIGPVTIGMINAADQVFLDHNIDGLRFVWAYQVVNHDPTQLKFFHSWVMRI